MIATSFYMSLVVLNKETILASEARKRAIYLFGALLYLLVFCDYS